MRWHIWEFHTFLGKTLSEVLHIESLLSVQIPDASHKQKHALGVTTHYQTNAWPRGGSDFPVPRGNQTPESTVLPRQCPPNRYKTRSVAVCSSLRLHEASAKKKKSQQKNPPSFTPWHTASEECFNLNKHLCFCKPKSKTLISHDSDTGERKPSSESLFEWLLSNAVYTAGVSALVPC